MPRISSIFNGKNARLLGAMVALAAGVAACKDSREPAPDKGVDYYPVKVGNYWVYAVTDTTWSQAPPTPSVPTASNYQFRETITEAFTDAAGQPAYRLTRARRSSSTAAWRDDSVFVLSVAPGYLALSRNNARRVELVFPVREGRSWNLSAFNSNDTITAETRQYRRVGQAYTTGGGTSGLAPATYSTTLTTNDVPPAKLNDLLLRRTNYFQVYAQGVGPVFRRRANFAYYNYTDASTGQQIFPANSYSSAFTRRETLIDYGPR